MHFHARLFFAHCKLLQKATDKNFLISTVKTCTCTCIVIGNRKLPLELQAKSGLQRIHVIIVEEKYAV